MTTAKGVYSIETHIKTHNILTLYSIKMVVIIFNITTLTLWISKWMVIVACKCLEY